MKAILVVDIGNEEILLNKKINAICFEDGDKIYDNFNFLKPMPEKDRPRLTADDFEMGWCRGWNECINEILGETE